MYSSDKMQRYFFLKLFLCIVVAINYSYSFSSNWDRFSAGIHVGYRGVYSNWGLVLHYKICDPLDLNLGLGLQKFEGAGIGGGIRFDILKTKKFSPYIGFNYISINGSDFAVDYGINKSGYYKTLPNEFFIPTTGLKLMYKNDYLLFDINYRIEHKNRQVVFLNGDYLPSTENRINNAIDGGLGCSISVIIKLNR